jgi:hypothetical protein
VTPLIFKFISEGSNRQKSAASTLCDRGGRNRGGLINTRLDFDDDWSGEFGMQLGVVREIERM